MPDPRENYLDPRGHRHKLRRASGHIDSMEATPTAWAQTGYRIFRQADGHGGMATVGELLHPAPDEVPPIIP